MIPRRLLVVAAFFVAVAAVVVVLERRDDPGGSVAVDPLRPSSTPTPAPSGTPRPSRQPPRTELACRAASGPFTPTSIAVDDVTTGALVLAVARDDDGAVGVPPLTAASQQRFAWDAPGVAPGSPRGDALFTAPTSPDGSALGNALLAGLETGDGLVVRGGAGERLCYDVVRREEVTAETAMPELDSGEGPPRVVILVRSGERRGPGDWSHRTLWFAEPA